MGHMVDGLKLDGRLSRGKTGENSTSVPNPIQTALTA